MTTTPPPAHAIVLVPTIGEARGLFGEAVAARIQSTRSTALTLSGKSMSVAVCGFGLAAAGAGASFALSPWAHERPPLVILAGIAGTFDVARCPVGAALIGTEAQSYGIGVGSGQEHVPASILGWPQGVPYDGLPQVDDRLLLERPHALRDAPHGVVLSVASASADRGEAVMRSVAHPDAVIEEMEGFAVGLACRLLAAPLVVVRGISNVCGDRDKSSWRISDALSSARELLVRVASTLR